MPKKPVDKKNIVENWRQNPRAIKKYSFIQAFLPQEEKRSRSLFLSTKALALYAVFFLVVLTSFKLAPKYLPGVLGYASDIYVDELIKYTNQRRAEIGLAPLKINSTLSKAAEAKARDMFQKNYWAHVAPDGTQPWDFIISAGYDYSYAGENLAKNFNSSKQVVDAWYESISHRENLLGSNYEDVGFAVVNGILDGYETTLVVQTFGKPRVPTYLSSAEPELLPEKSVEVPPSSEASSTQIDIQESSEELSVSGLVKKRDGSTLSFIDVTDTTKYIGLSFFSFLGILLSIDIWYSHKRGIRKISGHTLAHLIFLLFIFGGIWLVLSPGKIL